jgi:putative transposase
MTAPLSRDLRERIVRAVAGGVSIRQAAMRFAVSLSGAVKLMRRVRETGSATPGRIGGHRRSVRAPHEDLLRSLADGKDDITGRGSRPSSARAASSCRRSPPFTSPCAGWD